MTLDLEANKTYSNSDLASDGGRMKKFSRNGVSFFSQWTLSEALRTTMSDEVLRCVLQNMSKLW